MTFRNNESGKVNKYLSFTFFGDTKKTSSIVQIKVKMDFKSLVLR